MRKCSVIVGLIIGTKEVYLRSNAWYKVSYIFSKIEPVLGPSPSPEVQVQGPGSIGLVTPSIRLSVKFEAPNSARSMLVGPGPHLSKMNKVIGKKMELNYTLLLTLNPYL
jgi:hypothetical protein